MTKIKIRHWTDHDLSDLINYANNPNVAANMTDGFPHPYTETDGKNFIRMANSTDPVTIFAIDLNGKAIGGIGLHPQKDIYRYNAELGYWLAENYWGNGFVTEAIKQIVTFGFSKLDITRIYSRPFGTNKGSHKVLEKSGFTLEGRFANTIVKQGKILDELIYSLRK